MIRHSTKPKSIARRPLELLILEQRILMTSSQVPVLDARLAPSPPLLMTNLASHVSGQSNQDPEDDKVNVPAEVSGAFLYGTAEQTQTNSKPLSFDDVKQEQTDTCVFAATLSAVARTNFDLASGITLKQFTSSTNSVFSVRMYERDSNGNYLAHWIDVAYDGTVSTTDLNSTDPKEFWPALYQRAYLTACTQDGLDYHNPNVAYRSLTGGFDSTLTVNSAIARSQAQSVLNGLNLGNPTIAETIASGSLILDSSGLVHEHAYTILGVEIPAGTGSSGIYVTLRNPWGTDTDWTFFDTDHDGFLGFNDLEAYSLGLDGHNDGIIRILWDTFDKDFFRITTGDVSGPSINSPVGPPPVFNHTNLGPYTIIGGSTLGPIDASATDPLGGVPSYRLVGDSPGTVNLLSGQYSWEPFAGETGTFLVRILAETNPLQSAVETFQVTVTDGSPAISSLTSNLTSITTAGSELLTLTANNVSTPTGHIDHVDYYVDSNSDGFFDPTVDRYLGHSTSVQGNNWLWSGYVGGLTPGPQIFFAQAVRFSFSDIFHSDPASVSLTVTAAPAIPAVANAVSAEIPVDALQQQTVSQFGQTLVQDGSGHYYVYWNQPDTEVYQRELNSAAAPLANTNPVFAPGQAMLADGSYASAYYDSTGLQVQWYNSDGSVSQGRTTVSTDPPATNAYVTLAADKDGNLLVVWQEGGYFAEDIWAAVLTRSGLIHVAPWEVNTHTNGPQKYPTVALNADGVGIIAWTDFDQHKIIGRHVTAAGFFYGNEFDISNTTDGTVNADSTISSSVNSAGDFIVAWGTSNGVYARRFVTDNTPAIHCSPLGNEFLTNTYKGTVYGPKVVLNDLGWAVVAWQASGEDVGINAGLGIYAQVYDPLGNAVGPEFSVPTTFDYDKNIFGMILRNDGTLTVAWTKGGFSDPNRSEIFVRQFLINEPPLIASGQIFTIPENSVANTVLGTVQATDPNTSDHLSYSLPDSGPFAIDTNSGQLTVIDPSQLDFERTPTFVVTVRVTDDGTPHLSTTQSIIVNLTNVNEAPNVLPSSFTIPELSPNSTIVGVITGHDPDVGQTLTYSLVGTTPFAIDPVSGTLSVRDQAGLDFLTTPVFHLTVLVTDSATPALSTSDAVTVNLTAVNRTKLIQSNIAGPTSGGAGQPRVFTISASDPLASTQPSQFTYELDWNGDGNIDQWFIGPSGFQISHVFATPGNFQVQATALANNGHFSQPSLQSISVGTVVNQPDPNDATKTDLVIGGTSNDDTIQVNPGTSSGKFQVIINGASQGTFNATGRVLIFGQDGNDTIQIPTVLSLPVIIDGGTGTNTLNGPSSGGTWNLSGTNAGSLGTLSFANIETLLAGLGNDTFHFANGASIAGNIDGGGGTNTFDYSAYGGRVVASINSQAASGVNYLVSNSIANINVFIGSTTTSNLLVGPAGNSTWTVTSSNAGTIANGNQTYTFSAFPNLTGSAGNDTFLMNDGSSLSGSLDGGLGSNTLSYANYKLPMVISLGANAATAINHQSGGGVFDIQSMIGSSAATSILVGPDATTAWNITGANAGSLNDAVIPGGTATFSKFSFLTGGTGADTFIFASTGSVTGAIDGGSTGATNALNYANYIGRIVVSLSASAATGIHNLSSSSLYDIQNVVGNSNASNLLVGPAAKTSWNITAANAGNFNLSTSNFTFSNFPSLTGGSGNDTFKLVGNASLAGSVDGGGGSNTLDYSSYASRVNIALGAYAASGIHNLSGSGIADIQTIVGSSNAANILVGPNVDSTWTITGANTGTLSPTAYGTLSFSAFADLTGGTKKDDFIFKSGANVTGAIDGRSFGGDNTLDYTTFGARVVVNLSASAATGVHNASGGNVYDFQTIIGSTFANVAGSGGNLLVGTSDSVVTWKITGTNAGQVGSIPIAFSNFPSLSGSTGNDDFIFSNNVTLSGSLDGGSGNNTLDYSAWTSGITVNLGTNSANNLSKVYDINNVIGGSANDSITGNSSGGFLVGGAGADTLVAGSGRSVLIGGLGNDVVIGSTNDDLLIAGSTNYDNNLAALMAILAEWQSADSYANRVAALRAGNGLTQGNKLVWASTVHDDSGANTLIGDVGSPVAGELDWFFANLTSGHDTITDKQTSEALN